MTRFVHGIALHGTHALQRGGVIGAGDVHLHRVGTPCAVCVIHIQHKLVRSGLPLRQRVGIRIRVVQLIMIVPVSTQIQGAVFPVHHAVSSVRHTGRGVVRRAVIPQHRRKGRKRFRQRLTIVAIPRQTGTEIARVAFSICRTLQIAVHHVHAGINRVRMLCIHRAGIGLAHAGFHHGKILIPARRRRIILAMNCHGDGLCIHGAVLVHHHNGGIAGQTLPCAQRVDV